MKPVGIKGRKLIIEVDAFEYFGYTPSKVAKRDRQARDDIAKFVRIYFDAGPRVGWIKAKLVEA